MGYRVHHTIIVTGMVGWPFPQPQDAHVKAVEIFGDLVSQIIISPVNAVATFFITPCGSNEGWDDFEQFEQHRETFKDWLKSQNFEDGSSPYQWVEVQYGDDDDDNRVLEDSSHDHEEDGDE